MIKVAFFVEGQTERIFMDWFLRHIFCDAKLEIESIKQYGKKHNLITHTVSKTGNVNQGDPDYFFLIFDVGSDDRVMSKAVEEYPNMTAITGYDFIFGLKDLYPEDLSNLNAIKLAHKKIITKNKMQKFEVFFSVMEIEAWFIREYTHFAKLNSAMDLATVNAAVGMDLSADNVFEIPHPSDALSNLYGNFGLIYDKSEAVVHATVDSLDFGHVRTAVRDHFEDLDSMYNCILNVCGLHK